MGHRRFPTVKQVPMWYFAQKATDDEIILYALRKLFVDIEGKGFRNAGCIQAHTREDYKLFARRLKEMLLTRRKK